MMAGNYAENGIEIARFQARVLDFRNRSPGISPSIQLNVQSKESAR